MSIKLGEILEHLGYITSIVKLRSIINKEDKLLGQYLVDNELITKEQLNECLELQKLEDEELINTIISKISE